MGDAFEVAFGHVRHPRITCGEGYLTVRRSLGTGFEVVVHVSLEGLEEEDRLGELAVVLEVRLR